MTSKIVAVSALAAVAAATERTMHTGRQGNQGNGRGWGPPIKDPRGNRGGNGRGRGGRGGKGKAEDECCIKSAEFIKQKPTRQWFCEDFRQHAKDNIAQCDANIAEMNSGMGFAAAAEAANMSLPSQFNEEATKQQLHK